MANGGIVGVGTDNNLYTLVWVAAVLADLAKYSNTPLIKANGTWEQVPNSGSVIAVSGIRVPAQAG